MKAYQTYVIVRRVTRWVSYSVNATSKAEAFREIDRVNGVTVATKVTKGSLVLIKPS